MNKNLIKKLLFGYLLFSLNTSFATEISIIPQPVKMEVSKGTYQIDPSTTFYADTKNPLLQKQADYLKKLVLSLSAIQIKDSKKLANNQIRMQLISDKIIGAEGYHLEINPKGIRISANTDKGIFYGLQSLQQLLPTSRNNAALALPLINITDYPRFKWRGMMLDVSRHFFSVEAVKSYIDLLAIYKMNVFHWHLTDSEGWRLEIKKYPRLTKVGAWRKEIRGSVFYKKNQDLPTDTFNYGGFYTQEQAKDVVRYAADRNIMVVPEIEMPGHSDAAIAAYPELSCTATPQPVRSSFGGEPDALTNYCAGKDHSFEFLQNVLKEVMTIFPSDYIHIGGDEVNKTGWKKCASCQQRMKKENLKDEHELQSYFVKRIGVFLNQHHKKLIGWDEILDGGLAPGATVMSWRGEEGGIKAARLKHPVVMAPVNPLYLNRYQADTLKIQQPLAAKYSINTLKNVYDYDPIPAELNSAGSAYVLGAQGAIWTEFLSSINDVERMLLPRMLALSEVLWSPKQHKDWQKFNNKLYFHSRRLAETGRNVFMSETLLPGSLPLKASAPQAQNNYAIISPTDTPADLIAKAAKVTPSARQLNWQKLELTAFFHFGVNTYTNQEWGTGKEDPKIFNPENFDAMQWVKVAKDAGFKQVILTAKHHDGFCLWPTKTTTHSVKSSPWKNGQGDVMKAVAEACKKYGIGFGVYLSPWDMNSPVYGTAAYNDLFIAQLTELLTEYGQIDEVWFDGANGEGPNGKKQEYDFDRYYAHIRKLQPKATIAIMGPDIRWVGTETGYGRDTEWSVLPANNLSQDKISADSQQEQNIKPAGFVKGADIGSRAQIKDAKALVWYPAETDVSIRPGWFYHPAEDSKVKTPEKLLDIYYNSVGKNGVLLLNIPPDTKGLISKSDETALLEWARIRNATFKVNLAAKAKVNSANGINAKALLDNSYESYWTTKDKDSTATLEFQLLKAASFDVLQLQENIAVGQRIEKFSLEYWDQNSWKEITSGTTVGYKRLLKFQPVTATKVRLNITSSRLNPTLSSFGLFKEITYK